MTTPGRLDPLSKVSVFVIVTPCVAHPRAENPQIILPFWYSDGNVVIQRCIRGVRGEASF